MSTTKTARLTKTQTHVARLELKIDGESYALRFIDGGWRLRRLGTRARYHAKLIGQTIACDCQDYQIRRRAAGELCKHGRALAAVGLISIRLPAGRWA